MNTKILMFTTAIAVMGFGCTSTPKTEVSDNNNTEFSGDRDVASEGCNAEGFISNLNNSCDAYRGQRGNGKNAYISEKDAGWIKSGAAFCKEVNQGGWHLFIAGMRNTGKLAVVNVGAGCTRDAYLVGGTKDLKVIKGYVYFASNNGNAFVLSPNSGFSLLQSGHGNSYANTDPAQSVSGAGNAGKSDANFKLRSGQYAHFDNAEVDRDGFRAPATYFFQQNDQHTIFNDAN